MNKKIKFKRLKAAVDAAREKAANAARDASDASSAAWEAWETSWAADEAKRSAWKAATAAGGGK